MNTQEAAALLGIAAAFDNRKPDPDAAKAWSVALDGFRFEDCRDVIVAHYRGSSDWLMPSHIIAGVKRIRSKRLEEAPPLIPPAELDGDPIKTNAWLKVWRRRIADGDPAPTYGELRARNMPDLLAIGQSTNDTEESA